MAAKVTEYHAPNAKATKPPIALTVKTCPWRFATSMVVWSMRTLKGIRGIQLMKQKMLKMANRRKTTAEE